MKISYINLFFILILAIGCKKDEVELTDSIVNNLIIDSRFSVEIFASDIDSPRQMAEDGEGRIYVGSRRSGDIFALIDSDNNGQIDEKVLIANNLTFATGISFYDGDLFFSEINKIWKIENINSYFNSDLKLLPEKILITSDLPSDEWHGWKWIKHDKKGNIYTNVGAPCNICLSENPQYASILKYQDSELNYIAKGVRNSVGFDFHPASKLLFFTDNGRDWLGDDSPSCELNRVDFDGQFFGYPFKHASNVVDPEFGHINPGYDFVDPILELGAHVAPTGISFYNADMFPAKMKNNLFIVLHGSWNRTEKVGYKVIRVEIDESGNVINTNDFITGWLKNGKVFGRPSAPLVRNDGSLLLSDDKANVIYQVTYQNSL